MHRAPGVIFGGKLLMFGLGGVVVLTLAVMATLSASDWTKKRYEQPDYSRAAAVGAFVIVVLVLGFVLSRLL
jgi:Mn2+/Fe2+ NRAMP family transporter